MKISRRKIVWLIVFFFFLITLGRFLIFSFSLNNMKTTIEEEIEWATGLEASIEGDIRGHLLPSFSVVANKVLVKDEEYITIYAEKLDLELPLWSLFNPGFLIRGIVINSPEVVWTAKSIDKTIPFKPSEEGANIDEDKDSTKWKVDLVDIRILNGSFHYYDEDNYDTIHCRGVNLTSNSITLSGDADTLKFSDVLAKGKLTIDDGRINSLLMDSIVLSVEISNGILDVSHSSISDHGRNRHGNFYLDLSSDIPAYHIIQDIDGFRIEEFFSRFNADSIMVGSMDFSLDVRFTGNSRSDLWSSSNGEIQFNGKNLILYGINLDMVAKQFGRSQKFNLLDISALVLAGPVGIAVTKGSDYATLLLANKGDSTLVHEFVSRWNLDSGELKIADVAFSTNENRIAVRGSVNLWHDTFNDIEFALINEEGCAVYQQEISGSFTNPDVSDLKVVGTLLAPVRNLFSGKKCKKPFYEGSVKPYKKE